MVDKKPTLKERTLDYIHEFGSITSLEAIRDLGNTRLSGTIYSLKQDGYEFVTKYETAKNRWGDNTVFARYYLKEMLDKGKVKLNDVELQD